MATQPTFNPPKFAKPKVCKNHPAVLARWECAACHAMFCNECVKRRDFDGFQLELCPICRGRCISIMRPGSSMPAAPVNRQSSFFNRVFDAFAYPLRGHGVFLLIAYLIFQLVQTMIVFFPFIGFLAFFLYLGFGLYVNAFFMSVVSDSAQGKKELPDWPDITQGWDEILLPALQFIGTILFCFGPVIAINIYNTVWYPRENHSPVPMLILTCLGAFYFPMGLLAVVMYESLLAINPYRVLRSIARTLRYYMLLLVSLALVVGVLAGLSRIPIVHYISHYILNFYLTLVALRFIGLFYHTHVKRLGWLDE